MDWPCLIWAVLITNLLPELSLQERTALRFTTAFSRLRLSVCALHSLILGLFSARPRRMNHCFAPPFCPLARWESLLKSHSRLCLPSSFTGNKPFMLIHTSSTRGRPIFGNKPSTCAYGGSR